MEFLQIILFQKIPKTFIDAVFWRYIDFERFLYKFSTILFGKLLKKNQTRTIGLIGGV